MKGSNTVPNLQTPVIPSSPSLSPSDPSEIVPPLDGSEVVNAGELIITNFIDVGITYYNKISHTVLAVLDPSITDSDVIFARPLSKVPRSIERTSKPRKRIAVLLSSASLVNMVLLAKTRRTSFCTDDLDLSLLCMVISSRVKPCKIFVNEVLSKEKYRLFCNLRSAAKELGIKYVMHRGGRFMARARGRDRAHVFESLSDFQAIQSASRNKIMRPVACDAAGASGVGEPRPIVLGRGSSASKNQ